MVVFRLSFALRREEHLQLKTLEGRAVSKQLAFANDQRLAANERLAD
jgi:hypothetical protein